MYASDSFPQTIPLNVARSGSGNTVFGAISTYYITQLAWGRFAPGLAGLDGLCGRRLAGVRRVCPFCPLFLFFSEDFFAIQAGLTGTEGENRGASL